MRIFAPLFAGLTLVAGNCFEHGEAWATQRAYALAKAEEVCQLKFSITGWASGDIAGACYNLDSTKKVDFVLERVSSGDDERPISAEECYDGFQKEINNCGKGGRTAYGNWAYT